VNNKYGAQLNQWATKINRSVNSSVKDSEGRFTIKKILPWAILIFVIVIGKNLLGIVKSFFGKIEDKVVGPDLTDVHGSGEVTGVGSGALPVDPQKTSMSASDLKILADTISQAIYDTYLTENDAAIFEALKRVQTNDDWYGLINAYGVRDGGSWYNTAYNLPMALQTYLDNFWPYDYKNQLNALYKQRGINHVFN